jgi:hypothetical protein
MSQESSFNKSLCNDDMRVQFEMPLQNTRLNSDIKFHGMTNQGDTLNLFTRNGKVILSLDLCSKEHLYKLEDIFAGSVMINKSSVCSVEGIEQVVLTVPNSGKEYFLNFNYITDSRFTLCQDAPLKVSNIQRGNLKEALFTRVFKDMQKVRAQ